MYFSRSTIAAVVGQTAIWSTVSGEKTPLDVVAESLSGNYDEKSEPVMQEGAQAPSSLRKSSFSSVDGINTTGSSSNDRNVLTNNAVECDPTVSDSEDSGVDVGILQCDRSQVCMESIESSMGGYCVARGQIGRVSSFSYHHRRQVSNSI